MLSFLQTVLSAWNRLSKNAIRSTSGELSKGSRSMLGYGIPGFGNIKGMSHLFSPFPPAMSEYNA